jgi:polysaccharide export outer membrane protein
MKSRIPISIVTDALRAISVIALLILAANCGFAQTPSTEKNAAQSKERPMLAPTQSDKSAPAGAAQKGVPAGEAADSVYFENIYRNFYNSYRLGPNDEIAIRVFRQPDYTLEKVKISPIGRIFHPLVGEIDVAGYTVDELTRKLTAEFSEYVLNPKVSISLLEANSAKIGVLGEVVKPGIVIMTEPMTVMDAISASGGFTEHGSKSNVTLVRVGRDGRRYTMKVDLKKVLEGKSDGEDNLALQAGDTVIVNGNTRKKLAYVATLAGFTQFLTFITLSRF